jgi:DNA-binding transcriptional regulator GbsR (MarR family)
MDYKETQEEFVQLWGSLGTNWGINKAMAQIHALLLSVENPLTTDEIMERLLVSRSNANLNIRALLDWGLIYKKHVAGDRKEYFIAEKDMWDVAIKIMKERRRREVEPVVKELKDLATFEAGTFEEKNFKKLLNDTIELSDKLLNVGTLLEKADKSIFFKWIMKGF